MKAPAFNYKVRRLLKTVRMLPDGTTDLDPDAKDITARMEVDIRALWLIDKISALKFITDHYQRLTSWFGR